MNFSYRNRSTPILRRSRRVRKLIMRRRSTNTKRKFRSSKKIRKATSTSTWPESSVRSMKTIILTLLCKLACFNLTSLSQIIFDHNNINSFRTLLLCSTINWLWWEYTCVLCAGCIIARWSWEEYHNFIRKSEVYFISSFLIARAV